MKNVYFVAGATLLALSVSACATPEVVDVRQPGDRNLTCAQLEDQIDAASNFEEDARDERGVTGENIAAAVFFWPGLIATYANTEDAIDAAEDRRDHLMAIYEDKGCA
ncbi:MAG: hypothetical protein AAFX09_13230 [Pseudomonadota bacterium]